MKGGTDYKSKRMVLSYINTTCFLHLFSFALPCRTIYENNRIYDIMYLPIVKSRIMGANLLRRCPSTDFSFFPSFKAFVILQRSFLRRYHTLQVFHISIYSALRKPTTNP